MNFALSKKPNRIRNRLMREVAADDTRVGDGIVWLADAGQKQELHVEDGEGREDDEVCRLLPFLAAGVDESDAGRSLARLVVLMRVTSQLSRAVEVGLAHQDREDRRLRARLGIIAAAEPFAEATIRARPQPHAERVV